MVCKKKVGVQKTVYLTFWPLLRLRRAGSHWDHESRSYILHMDSGLDESFCFIQESNPGFSIIFTV